MGHALAAGHRGRACGVPRCARQRDAARVRRTARAGSAHAVRRCTTASSAGRPGGAGRAGHGGIGRGRRLRRVRFDAHRDRRAGTARADVADAGDSAVADGRGEPGGAVARGRRRLGRLPADGLGRHTPWVRCWAASLRSGSWPVRWLSRASRPRDCGGSWRWRASQRACSCWFARPCKGAGIGPVRGDLPTLVPRRESGIGVRGCPSRETRPLGPDRERTSTAQGSAGSHRRGARRWRHDHHQTTHPNGSQGSTSCSRRRLCEERQVSGAHFRERFKRTPGIEAVLAGTLVPQRQRRLYVPGGGCRQSGCPVRQ